jgi:hypothetical protein
MRGFTGNRARAGVQFCAVSQEISPTGNIVRMSVPGIDNHLLCNSVSPETLPEIRTQQRRRKLPELA